MEVVITTSFGYASGVVDDLIGREKSTLVCDKEDILLILGEIISELAQGNDIKIRFCE